MKLNLIFLLVFAIFLFPLASSISLTNVNITSSGLNSSIFVDNLVLDNLQITNVSIEFTGITSPCSISFLNFTDSNKNILMSSILTCLTSNPESVSASGSPAPGITQQQLENGYEVTLQKNEQIQVQFQINGKMESHTIRLNSITNESVSITISSSPITFNLSVNETKKIDINGDGYYDLSIFLKNITNNNLSADLVIKTINEQIPAEETGGINGNNSTSGTIAFAGINIGSTIFYVTIMIIIMLIIIFIYFLIRRIRKRSFYEITQSY